MSVGNNPPALRVDYTDNDPDRFLVFPDAFGQNLANIIVWWNYLRSSKSWR
jgi:hypothetical protein